MLTHIQAFRARVGDWIEHPQRQLIIIGVILVNAVTLGLETVPEIQHTAGNFLHLLDQVILAIFVIEIALKLIGHGGRFFQSPWNVFDFLIVGIALVPAASALSILRTLRVFRLLRLLNKVPRLRQIIEAMLMAIPSIGWVTVLLLLIFYIFAVIGTNLFGQAFPAWFGGIGPTLYTLFQIMTLESWSMGIARPVIEVFPYAVFYFVPFILISTYSMLNLFIAIIVSTMQALSAAEAGEDTAAAEKKVALVTASNHHELVTELRQLHEKVAGLEGLLKSVPVLYAPDGNNHAITAVMPAMDLLPAPEGAANPT